MIALVFGILSGVLYALMFIFLRSISQGVSPLLAATIQMVSISIFLVIACLVQHELTPQVLKMISSAQQAPYVLAAGVTGGLSWIFYMLALKYGNGAIAGVISDQLSVVLTPLLAFVILKEPLSLVYGISTLFFLIGAWIAA